MGDRLWSLLAAVAVLVAGCGGDDRSPAQSQGPAAVPTVLILDASGSMNETDAPGPRIDAAKRAAQGLVDGLPDGTATALLAYGTSTGSSDAEKTVGCQDVKVLIPMGSLDRQQMAAQISGLSASGYTPISLALRTAITQLPAGDDPQAIILVSDGEDTCGAPPCDTAKEAEQKYPNVAISTIGFKTEGNASDQLRCIAQVTGGLFVQADNANQLAARLLATQNIEQAQNSLSSNGIGDIALGTKLADVRKVHRDFPNASTSGSVIVVYRDCDFGFTDGILDSITPHTGGRTIDGVTAGTPLARVIELYGNPLTTETNGSGSYRLTFAADPTTDAGYRITVDDYADAGGTITGTVNTIVLCRCAPHSGPPAIATSPAVEQGITFGGYADVLGGMTVDQITTGGWQVVSTGGGDGCADYRATRGPVTLRLVGRDRTNVIDTVAVQDPAGLTTRLPGHTATYAEVVAAYPDADFSYAPPKGPSNGRLLVVSKSQPSLGIGFTPVDDNASQLQPDSVLKYSTGGTRAGLQGAFGCAH